MTTTDDLATWLRATLDRVEQQAKAASAHPDDDGIWTAGEGEWQAGRIDGAGITIYDEGGHTAEQAAHIAFWDPARVLRLVEATRRILDEHGSDRWSCQVCANELDVEEDSDGGSREYRSAVNAPCLTLRLSAMWLNDQPGYQEEWRV